MIYFNLLMLYYLVAEIGYGIRVRNYDRVYYCAFWFSIVAIFSKL